MTPIEQAIDALMMARDFSRRGTGDYECYNGAITALQSMQGEASVTVKYDLSPAETDGAIQAKLIELGWTPPSTKPQSPAVDAKDAIDDIWACANSGYSLDGLKTKIKMYVDLLSASQQGDSNE